MHETEQVAIYSFTKVLGFLFNTYDYVIRVQFGWKMLIVLLICV